MTWAHLVKCLSFIGAHQKSYYSGALSVGQCTKMLKNIDVLCTKIFHTNLGTLDTAISSVHGIQIPKYGLKKLGSLYNYNLELRGMGFDLASQSPWSEEMVQKWIEIFSQFMRISKKTIGHPKLRSKLSTVQHSVAPWREPLSIPKLYTLTFHVGSTVRRFGPLGSLAEESFENYQSISQKQRVIYSRN